MAETSRSRVTITLGRSGQVVKRAGVALDSFFSDSEPTVNKRSVKDRLGSVVDETSQVRNKRQRGDGNWSSLHAADEADSMLLGKDDLRFKIRQKSLQNGSESNGRQNGVDLREKLSRPSQDTSTSARRHISERKDAGWSIPESKDFRHHMSIPKDVRQCRPELKDVREYRAELKDVREYRTELKDVREYRAEPNDVSQYRPEPREIRQYRPELKDVGLYRPETKDVRHYRPEAKDVRCPVAETKSFGILGRIPSTSNNDMFSRTDSSRSSYSPWTLERLRRRSPGGISGAFRDLSPQRTEDQMQRRPLIRTYDDVRMNPYIGKDVHELSRPMSSASFMSKTPAASSKPLTPVLAPHPPPGSLMQSNTYAVEEHTVDGLLHSLGLEKYAINFKAEEVDLAALRQMGDIDLKELGIPMGPRKKILLALLSRSRR